MCLDTMVATDKVVIETITNANTNTNSNTTDVPNQPKKRGPYNKYVDVEAVEHLMNFFDKTNGMTVSQYATRNKKNPGEIPVPKST